MVDIHARQYLEDDHRMCQPVTKIPQFENEDPHIKVTGKIENVVTAKDKIMAVLDTKSNRVTLKMDVSYTEHSHVIGKGGNIIKKVMQDTGCHIHFPDSNRGSQQEKSNQVSIAGQIGGVEQARAKVRELLPLVLVFELPITNNPTPDINSPTIQQIVQLYNIGVNMKQRARGYSTTVTVRGSSSNAVGVKEGTMRLMEHLIGNIGVTLPVSTQIEIAPQHHQFMSGRGGLNVKQIMQGTGATIHFPDPNNAQRKSTVFISGPVDSVIIARHLLMGCLPLVLMFDVKEEVDIDASKLAQLMEQLDVFISIKPKPRQPSKSVIVKSIERNAPSMYRARQILLGQECESCAANCSNATRGLNGTSLPLSGLLNSNLVSINTSNLLSVNGLSRVSPLQSPRSSVSGPNGLTWPAVSQQSTGLSHSFPAGVTPVLISQQTIKPLLVQPGQNALQNQKVLQSQSAPQSQSACQGQNTFQSQGTLQGQTALQGQSACQGQSTLQSQGTLQSFPNQVQNPTHIPSLNPVPNPTPVPITNPALNPNVSPPVHLGANPLFTPTTAPTSPPPLANPPSAPIQLAPNMAASLQVVTRPAAEPTQAYILSSAALPVTNTVVNTEPHKVAIPSAVRANPQAEAPKTIQQNTMAQQLTYIPQHRVSQPEPHRVIYPTPHQTEAQRVTHSSPQRVHPTSPPPGLTKADPDLLSTELQRLHMAAKAAQLISSCGGEELTEHIAQASQIDRQLSSPTKDRVMSSSHSNTSSGTSPNQSPCNSPIDLISMPTTPPISSSNNNNPKLVDLGYLQNNISPNNSNGNLSGVLMGSGGRGSLTLLQDGTLGLTGSGLAYHTNGRRSSESGGDSDSSDKRAPGCERRDRDRERGEWERGREKERQEEVDRLALQSTSASYGSIDYDQKKLKANKAMKKKPIGTEVRRPTDQWSGLGFSKSMPESAIREQRKPNGFSLFHTEKLPTTYENTLKEETENGTTDSSWPPDQPSPSIDLMTCQQPEQPQPTSAAPGEYPANRKKKVTYTNLSCSNYIEGSSLPGQTKGLWSSSEGSNSLTQSKKPDLADLFINLGLGKYADVFQQQEIDLSTFLTLTDNDLKELGITTFGARRKMRLAISNMNKGKTKPSLFSANNSSSLLHEGSNGSNGLIQSSHGHESPTSVW
ncbi:protein bicaudal C homolog 1-A-like isoform X2 [Acanthaster planci]|uniref:Protein bicaudal C homolog 1-A-like isoform X2 n=1 Tax=Acanthaster planci TaxID=133434 RepID=A0A8B7YK24_ACAPL|nr:protein bicaudal C homolog 1-A-like isoform X2 [Acanthaster planci]